MFLNKEMTPVMKLLRVTHHKTIDKCVFRVDCVEIW